MVTVHDVLQVALSRTKSHLNLAKICQNCIASKFDGLPRDSATGPLSLVGVQSQTCEARKAMNAIVEGNWEWWN